MSVYAADKVWRALKRQDVGVARCTVQRLMRRLGLRGAMRGKGVRPAVPDAKAACPQDRVNRVFRADRPNQLWVSDFTCVSCSYLRAWQGFVCMACPVDELVRRVRAAHRGLARERLHAHRLRAGRAGAGAV